MGQWAEIDAGLTGPDFFVGDEFYGAFDVLRAEDPVHWTHDAAGGRHFWSLTRHDDCVDVLNNPYVFSNKLGSQLPPKGACPTPEYLHKIGADVRLTQQDPPFHKDLRKPLNPHFSVPAVKRYRPEIEEIVDHLIDQLRERRRVGAEVDLIEDLCAQLPVHVFLKFMDVPREHWEKLRALAAAIVNPDDPLLADGRDPREIQSDAFAETFAHMRQDLMARRERPASDDNGFAGKLANLKLDGELLSERWVGWMATTIVAAGLETTRDAAGLGLREFIRRPEQVDLLAQRPELIGPAVEEVLRWSTPPRQRLRVVTEDTVIRGRKINKGDWVVTWLSAANRDPEVFERPNEFDITREKNPHITFSEGTHICLGRNLARLELEVLIPKFLAAFTSVTEVDPGAQWNSGNNFIASLRTYPVRLSA